MKKLVAFAMILAVGMFCAMGCSEKAKDKDKDKNKASTTAKPDTTTTGAAKPDDTKKTP